MNVIYKKLGKRYRRDIGDVVAFSADSKYISAFFADGADVLIDGISVDNKISGKLSLKHLSKLLLEQGYSQFVLVHRSWLVNLERMEHLKGDCKAGNFFVTRTIEVPVSRRNNAMAKHCFLTSRDGQKDTVGKEICYG